MSSFINFIKFLFGARYIEPEATKLAWETVGSAILERVKVRNPELRNLSKKQFATYFGNPWLDEQSAKIYKDKGEMIEKSLSNIEWEINKLLTK